MDSVQVLVPVLVLVLDSVQVLFLVPVLILVLDSVHDLVLVLVPVLILVPVVVLCSHPRWSFPSLLSDDDIIFEDFARQRLTGAQDDKEEDEEPAESPKLDQR